MGECVSLNLSIDTNQTPHYNKYVATVVMDDEVVNSGTFQIVMTIIHQNTSR